MFQFTPARGGRRGPCGARPVEQLVSIHARAWRATRCRAPGVPLSLRFNSRPRVAGDPTRRRGDGRGRFQFTPARGGRHASHSFAASWIVFQFTPARGGRPHSPSSATPTWWFQFTPARGGRRHFYGHNQIVAVCFNSRPRVAGDQRIARVLECVEVSIHARAWRATLGGGCRSYPRVVSIHARAWRATRAFSSLPPFSLFQFTPARGGRHGRRARVAQPGRFNSRPRVAGDPRATARSRRR